MPIATEMEMAGLSFISRHDKVLINNQAASSCVGIDGLTHYTIFWGNCIN